MSELLEALAQGLRDRGATSIERMPAAAGGALLAASGTGWSAGIGVWPTRARISAPVFLRHDIDCRPRLDELLAGVDRVIEITRSSAVSGPIATGNPIPGPMVGSAGR